MTKRTYRNRRKPQLSPDVEAMCSILNALTGLVGATNKRMKPFLTEKRGRTGSRRTTRKEGE